MAASARAPIRPRVSGVCGAAITTTSASGRRSGSRSGGAIATTGGSSARGPVRRMPVTAASSAANRRATAVPMDPRPTTSTRASAMVLGPGGPNASPCAHRRACCRATSIGRPRNIASVTAMTCSAIVVAPSPREFVRTTGEATSSGNSIPPTPAAGLWSQRSRRAAANCAGLSVDARTTSASAISPGTSSARVAWAIECSGKSARSRSTCSSGRFQNPRSL